MRINGFPVIGIVSQFLLLILSIALFANSHFFGGIFFMGAGLLWYLGDFRESIY